MSEGCAQYISMGWNPSILDLITIFVCKSGSFNQHILHQHFLIWLEFVNFLDSFNKFLEVLIDELTDALLPCKEVDHKIEAVFGVALLSRHPIG